MVKGNGKPLKQAVGYLRRSTDKQEASIRDQRKAVEKYADENGYRILRWYTDDGVSGDATEKRFEFQRMIADAGERRDFAWILCWDQDRFGRFDMMEAGHWARPLRKAGVSLVPINEGPIDWEDFTGRLMYSVKQEAKHAFLLDLSRNVLRGQIEAAKAGSWSGSAPYAYRIVGERKQKRIEADDPVKADIVRRIFREYVEQSRSMSEIATRLNADGVPSPGERGKPWRFDAVKTILENVAYVGTFRFNVYSRAKYNGYRDGVIVKGAQSGLNPESDWIVIPNHHEALIDQPTFDAAQAILARGKTGRSSKYTADENPYRLAGVLRCGLCGSQMWGVENRRYRYYECSRRKYDGADGCEGCTVREDKVMEQIADYLENWLGPAAEFVGGAAYYGVLNEKDLPEAFAEVRKLLMPRKLPQRDRKRMEDQLEQTRAKLTKARANLVLLDANNIPAAQEQIRQLDEQRQTLEAELAQTKPPAEKDINAVALELLHNLYDLAASCRVMSKPDPDDGFDYYDSAKLRGPIELRRFLKHVDRIVVHTSKTGRGTGTRNVLDRGEIVFRGVGVATGKSNRHLLG